MKTLQWIIGLSLVSTLATNVHAAVRKVDAPFVYAQDVLKNCNDYCSVQIATSPAPGAHLVLHARDIVQPLTDAGFAVQKRHVPKTIKIVRRSRRADATEMNERARSAVLRVLPQGAVLEDMADVQGGKVPVGDFESRATFDETKMFQRTVSVSVEFMSGGVSFRKVYVLCKLAYLVKVPVAAHAILRNAVVQPSDITFKEMAMTPALRHIAMDYVSVVGLKTKSAIREGEGFEQRNLEELPVVRRGDMMILVSNLRGIKITVRGYARQDAARGARIAVEIPSLNRMLFAKVIGAGQGVVQQ